MMDKFFSFRNPEPQKKQETAKKKIYRSEDLFAGEREIVIEHGDARYRLQITKAGKLILNK